MKLEVEMYVRTLNGIVKIDKIRNGIMKDKKGHLHFGDFIKASHNIIDLIEVGDYVNGREIRKISIYEDGEKYLEFVYDFYSELYEDDIKSILTKEQFESMSYKVEE